MRMNDAGVECARSPVTRLRWAIRLRAVSAGIGLGVSSYPHDRRTAHRRVSQDSGSSGVDRCIQREHRCARRSAAKAVLGSRTGLDTAGTMARPSRVELYAAIRRGARTGPSGREAQRKHGVAWRTVQDVLALARPSAATTSYPSPKSTPSKNSTTLSTATT